MTFGYWIKKTENSDITKAFSFYSESFQNPNIANVGSECKESISPWIVEVFFYLFSDLENDGSLL